MTLGSVQTCVVVFMTPETANEGMRNLTRSFN